MESILEVYIYLLIVYNVSAEVYNLATATVDEDCLVSQVVL
jgi:hypothetical protein